MRKVTRQPIISPSGIQWTSIEKETGKAAPKGFNDGAIEVALEAEGEFSKDDVPHQSILDYLRMLSRNRLNAFDSTRGDVETLVGVIEGSLKLSQNVKFPKQSKASLSDKCIPEWFTTARQIAHDAGGTATEFSALQSIAALSQGKPTCLERIQRDDVSVFLSRPFLYSLWIITG